MKRTEESIIVEEEYKAGLTELWAALTDRDQMVQWFFPNILAFEAKEGFSTQFVVENEGRVFTHLWTIMDVIPEKKILYRWRYEAYEGDSMVLFEISGDENSCKLCLTHKVLENFNDDIPEFSRESCQDGWNYFLKERLKSFLST